MLNEFSERIGEKNSYAVHGMDGLNVVIQDNKFAKFGSVEGIMREAVEVEGTELTVVPREHCTVYIYSFDKNADRWPLFRKSGNHDHYYNKQHVLLS